MPGRAKQSMHQKTKDEFRKKPQGTLKTRYFLVYLACMRENRLLFIFSPPYARESLIVHLSPPYARESLIVHLSPPYARESLIVHLSPPYACECSRSTNGSAIHSTAGPASSGFVSGRKSSSPETEIRVPSRFHPPESRGNRHFFGKTSRLFRENFLFIGKNGVYYSFTHTILRST